jgi:hypothetical protein
MCTLMADSWADGGWRREECVWGVREGWRGRAGEGKGLERKAGKREDDG